MQKRVFPTLKTKDNFLTSTFNPNFSNPSYDQATSSNQNLRLGFCPNIETLGIYFFHFRVQSYL